jgi:predicted RNase H-like HicB family nuclease
MRYPIAIETGTGTASFGVIVPDLPGCFSAGDTYEEAIAGADEAVAVWINAALDAREAIPSPSSLDRVRAHPSYTGWTFDHVVLDSTLLADVVERSKRT